MSLYYGSHIIAGNPQILSATDDKIGGFKTGYIHNENKYPVLLDNDAKAFVDISCDLSGLVDIYKASDNGIHLSTGDNNTFYLNYPEIKSGLNISSTQWLFEVKTSNGKIQNFIFDVVLSSNT